MGIIATATEENLHRAMQYFNSRVALRYNKLVHRSGHLWGDRYRSCIISTDDYYNACVRYIYRNPLRAGMVKDLQEFENSSLQFYAFGRKMDVILANDHLVMIYENMRENFQRLVEVDTLPFSDMEMKRNLKRLFFGPADFIERMAQTHLRG